MQWGLAALALAGWVLAAAKAHGRQIRIEREQQGVFHVDFRGPNPASVEEIWRRDRRLFWACFAVFALGVAASALLAGEWAVASLAAPAAFALAFTIAGIASWVRMALRRKGPLPWRRRAHAGSAAWWGLVVVAVALMAWATLAG